ncbi:pyridoxal kinase PdxY [Craterilacuibacter sinensis]|uniref:Pyridoxal kinase PdxY n=1 Tax=Craterilacuibacter sinensis TaxID=2686017 RepID=A0A845BKG3_9NEIS|nr:pyridoxal kinase PdxY [Craterilacuibacter sinensis]MXR36762.1 pyridoxal kinase PdxY [Craterilacuibacter sinensis]
MNILSIQSHVVYGHAGNSAAVFPMQRMGANVWPLHTVQFSNHTQYGRWAGMVMPSTEIASLAGGIAAIDALHECSAVLSGYIGSAEQGAQILDAVRQVKAANPAALYHCDPVMGHPAKGCIVASGVAEFLVNEALPVADIVSPNQLELEIIAGRALPTLADIVAAAREVLTMGPRVVLIKHLHYADKQPERFEMLAVSNDEAWLIARPIFDFARDPVGVGDMTSGLFLVGLLSGKSLRQALEHCASAVYGMLQETQRLGRYELAVVAAQREYESPTHMFAAQPI